MAEKITREQFIKNYYGSESEYLDRVYQFPPYEKSHPRVAIPCECGWGDCQGWRMAYVAEIEDYFARGN